MSFSNGNIAQLFLALALLLVAAHVLGWACARLGQPRVADDGQHLPATGLLQLERERPRSSRRTREVREAHDHGVENA